MFSCQPEAVCIPVGQGVVLLGRVRLNSGQYVTQADLDSIDYLVTLDGVEVESGEITIASAIHDTLQTSDARWTKDKTGFNFEWDAPYTLFAAEGVYLVVLTFTPAGSGNPVKAKWEVVARAG